MIQQYDYEVVRVGKGFFETRMTPLVPGPTAQTGTLFDIRRFTVHDGPGIRTTVFLKGCLLDCWWCHNPESRSGDPQPYTGNGSSLPPRWTAWGTPGLIGRQVSVEEVIEEVQKDTLFYEESGGGVTFSGGEPLHQPDFLQSLLVASRRQDIHTAVDTSGYAPWSVFEEILPLTGLFLFDLKLADDTLHRTYTGLTNRPIVDNLRRLHDGGAAVQVRIPLIPGITDSDENLEHIARLLRTLPRLAGLSLLPYNPIGEGKYQRLGLVPRLGSLQTQSDETLDRIRRHFDTVPIEVQVGG